MALIALNEINLKYIVAIMENTIGLARRISFKFNPFIYVKVVSYLYDQTKTAKPHVFHTWLSWKTYAIIGILYELKSNGHQLLMQ